MTTQEKISKLKTFKNEREFREFLIDFLKKCGFTDVIHTHRYGSPEQGKDIIAKYPHELEGDDWYAFVVKLGRVGGGTNEIETIKNQIKQSFEYPYKGVDGKKLKINKVKVVTNENFTSGAQSQISDSPELNIYNNFGFWWNENLIPLIDKKYDDYWLPGDAFSKEYSKEFTKKLQGEIEIRELSIRKIDDKKIQKLLDIFVEPKLTTLMIEEDKRTKEKIEKRKQIKVNSISEITENLLLSGEQGAGKSKVLNTIACNLSNVENITKSKSIPVRLKAPHLRPDFNIESAIHNQVKLLSNQFFQKEILDLYKIVVFVDDVDLLKSSEKELLMINLKKYCEANNTHYVITYRRNEFDYDLDVRKISIHNFNIRQVEAFVTKFFEGTDRGKRFIQILKESDILSKLPMTPLTITLISLLYDENNFEIPATLSDIYNDFTAVLLGKLEIENGKKLLIYNLKRRLFTALALKMLDNKVFEIPYNDFGKFINSFLIDRGYLTHTHEEINDIIDKSGLLFRDGNDIIGFKQQSFVEFFASLEIYHHKRETHYKKLTTRFNDVNWQNTAIFYAGHSKELTGMIDDVINQCPNDTLKDWFINSGGMGYLAQALYQEKPKERKKLILKSVDNLSKAFYEIKKLSKNEDSFFYGIHIPAIMTIIIYWFIENFKSITLTKTLEESFDEIYEMDNDFDNNFKLLMLSSTLMNPYINNDECFSKLLDRDDFLSHPIFPLIADAVMELGYINGKNISDKQKRKIKRSLTRKREHIKSILKEPAYRFNNKFSLEK